MATTRTRALDAAVELLGTEGLRALTHARVDAKAGLPKGSTSNHFRTRAELLAGVVDWIVEKEKPPVGAALAPASVDDLVDTLCAVFEYTTTANRVLTTARLVLFMEASHDERLRAAIVRARDSLITMVVPMLADLGARDPETAARAMAATFDGLILHRIAGHDTTDPRPVIDLVVRAALR